MSIFAELKPKSWFDWEIWWRIALFGLSILMSLLCSFKRTRRFLDVSPIHFNLQFIQGIQLISASETMLPWGLDCTKSRIVLEGKEAVLKTSLFKMFIMILVEKFLDKAMNVCVCWGGTSFVRESVGISLRLILIIDFEDFKFCKVHKRSGVMSTTQECCEQYWTSPGGNTPQGSSCKATYHPSRKPSKLDEPDMQDIGGEVGTGSLVMYSYWTLQMAEKKQGD